MALYWPGAILGERLVSTRSIIEARSILGDAAGTYESKVLGYGPVAYYRFEETAGANAADTSGNGYTGTYINAPTLGQVGRVNFCPLLDGTNQCVDVLASAAGFSGVAGTISAWARVSGAGVWADGSVDYLAVFMVDANNFVRIYKSNAANTLIWQYMANAVSKSVVDATHAITGWQLLSVTWDKNAGATGEVLAYSGGSQVGATQTNLGVWAGAPVICVFGAATAAGVTPWNGWIDEAMLFDRALSATDLADLASP